VKLSVFLAQCLRGALRLSPVLGSKIKFMPAHNIGSGQILNLYGAAFRQIFDHKTPVLLMMRATTYVCWKSREGIFFVSLWVGMIKSKAVL
jgi:hypothetical protein